MSIPLGASGLAEAVAQLRLAASAKKCWPCGCLRETLDALDRALPGDDLPAELGEAMSEARGRLLPARYDCLGCETCHPAIAANALNDAADRDLVEPGACAVEDVRERAGWPPVPGSYTVLRAHACVAACTLTDEALASAVVAARPSDVAIVGTLLTENLGIERLVRNVVANPRIRFLVVAGADSPGAVGHLPGGSLVALARNGIDAGGRIIGAPGRRPVLRNVPPGVIEHFRANVEVVDLIGTRDVAAVIDAARACGLRDPGAADALVGQALPETIRGAVPERVTPDAAGWFVIDPDRRRGLLRLEHYTAAGALDAVIEGTTATEAYCTAIDRALVTRLDHAAYLGKELARAEEAMRRGEPYVQDAAPERGGEATGTSGRCCDPPSAPCPTGP